MYSIENLYERLETLIQKYYLKQNPLSLILAKLNSDQEKLTEEIVIKQDFSESFKKTNLLTKEEYMIATMDCSKAIADSFALFENERFLMRLRKVKSTKIILKLDDLKKINPNDDLLLVCNEKTKLKLLEKNIKLNCKMIERFPNNMGIIASVKDFLSNCAIDSFNLNSSASGLKLNIECLEFKNIEDDYGRYIFEERRKLDEKEIQKFINENYKLNLSHEFKIRFPKEASCIVFEI